MGNMNINSSIAQYVQKTGVDVSYVTESLERVRENLTSGSSVFNVGDNATAEQFCDYMSQFAGDTCKDCYAEDVSVLFNVLDADGDGVLSTDEMKVIQQSNKGVVNEFGVWNSLHDLDTNKINEELSKSTQNPSDGINGTSQPTISDAQAEMLADQLNKAMDRWGTDEDSVENILASDGLNSADITKIVAIYNQKYGSLVNDIDGDFSGKDNKKYQQIIADALCAEVDNDNQMALGLLCHEFSQATEGRWGTSDPFIARIMESGSDKAVAQMAVYYNQVMGSDIHEAVKGDFSFGTEDNYLARLNQALTNYKV